MLNKLLCKVLGHNYVEVTEVVGYDSFFECPMEVSGYRCSRCGQLPPGEIELTKKVASIVVRIINDRIINARPPASPSGIFWTKNERKNV